MDDETVLRLLEEMQAARRQIDTLTALVGAQAQVIATTAVPSKQTTIAELFEAYAKIRSFETSWGAIRNKLAPLVKRLGKLRASALTPTVWAEHFVARKLQPTARDKPPADHTLNIELGRAKEMLDWGVRSGLVEVNALKDAKKAKTISQRETFLTEPQVQELLGGISDLPTLHAQQVTRAFILCAYDSMLRLNEVRHLRRDRIDRDGCVELRAKQVKSRKRRTIALTPRALEAIAEIPPALGSHFVFANPATGRPYGITAIYAWFRVAVIASGVDKYAAEGERVVLHTLRHSGATAADARGASPMAIKEALGHASLATTAKYLHRHSQDSAREMARLMARGAERDLAESAESQRRGPHMAINVGCATPKATRDKKF